ncbi:phosphoribosylaminoimidazolesuccinocarboxamide synthase [Tepidibacter thalassicus]|uniref:Phosphoribosylaminoimidazole-succinocarboxamide synthase n=1 Tax=Tepidibacter thalassicus DSM 15285 TaxID=1123350 RepID=A0A1M5SSC4_9FIRM|nr:phosphoribosylaminoimidazolesuccinocarboxamide synthase [Tepidibacter thalassicus]SHH41406.1 phosphoribosylaminoimidazole-succinocarboxamide synthase [Tepidibacter thalassicus DSM 15285]
MEMLYEGKAKKIFKTDNENECIIYFKDDATAFNGLKKDEIYQKGIVNNKISSRVFEFLESKGIKTHYIKSISDREMLVKAVEILPIEVIVRNISAGSMCKRLGIDEGIEFEKPVLEFSYKNDELKDPLINDDHAMALKLATKEEIDYIKNQAIEINNVLKEFFKNLNLKLVDFKLEFGKTLNGEIILADEVSPDTCRFWDINTNEKLDKDRFRRDLGNVIEGYKEVLNRMG